VDDQIVQSSQLLVFNVLLEEKIESCHNYF
jgi:hypothetical protein